MLIQLGACKVCHYRGMRVICIPTPIEHLFLSAFSPQFPSLPSIIRSQLSNDHSILFIRREVSSVINTTFRILHSFLIKKRLCRMFEVLDTHGQMSGGHRMRIISHHISASFNRPTDCPSLRSYLFLYHFLLCGSFPLCEKDTCKKKFAKFLKEVKEQDERRINRILMQR